MASGVCTPPRRGAGRDERIKHLGRPILLGWNRGMAKNSVKSRSLTFKRLIYQYHTVLVFVATLNRLP
jgi:hypothetical protein